MTREEAINFLRDFGVEPDTEGVFVVPQYPYEELSVEVLGEETKAEHVLPPPDQIPRRAELVGPAFLPCFFGFEPWCWELETKPPSIAFDIRATAVEDLVVHVMGGRIVGEIETEFTNNSEPGMIRRRNRRTGETTPWEVVEESSDLRGEFSENIFLRAIQEVLADIRGFIRRTSGGGMKYRTENRFEKRGVVELIQTILSLLLTGRISVNDTVNTVVYWWWEGQRHTKTRRVRIIAHLPVRNVRWSLF